MRLFNLLLLLFLLPSLAFSQHELSLAGEWEVAFDKGDELLYQLARRHRFIGTAVYRRETDRPNSSRGSTQLP